ncbi:hypothetical protein C8T65DRAFT_738561 [Cerioporus squamosus]|nr:hypothetical protein C8T65DRAFT_738561 [Cerioporus squamosus]
MSRTASGEDFSKPRSFRPSSYSTLANWNGDKPEDHVAWQTLPTHAPHPTRPSPEALLDEFYLRRSKRPTCQEQYELSRATGLSAGAIAQWFLSKRDADPSWASTRPVQTPWDIQKPRVRFTVEQQQRLEGYYQLNNRPGTAEQAQYAVELGVDVEAIYNWFDRRRRQKI